MNNYNKKKVFIYYVIDVSLLSLLLCLSFQQALQKLTKNKWYQIQKNSNKYKSVLTNDLPFLLI